MHDEHMQELNMKETSTKAASRREATKLATLVKDLTAALYGGCKAKQTRLSVTMNLMDIKAKSNSTDASVDMNLKYLHDVLPKGNVVAKKY